MKKIHLFVAITTVVLAGCTKSEPAVSLQSNEEIAISSYVGRAVTKGSTAYTANMNVSAFITSDQDKYFENAEFKYDSESEKFYTTPAKYWPIQVDGTGIPVDFYAVSSTSKSYSITVSGENNNTKTIDATTTAISGTDDIVATYVTDEAKGDDLSLSLEHKLTKVAFKAIGAETRLKYVISAITVKAYTKGTYTFGESEAWSGHSASDTYTFTVTNGTLVYNTATAQTIGAAGYGLMLIPSQPSAEGTVQATFEYSVEEDTGIEIYKGSRTIDLSSSANINWGINKSIVYVVTLPVSDDSKAVSFSGEVSDWNKEKEVTDQTL